METSNTSPKNIASLRVSTNDGRQSTERQFAGKLGQFDAVFEDHMTGTKINRPELTKCLALLEEGDTLHVWEISRLSRSLTDLRKTVFDLMERGVNVKFHKEALEFVSDDSNPMKKAVSTMMLNFLGSIAEFDRAMIVSRIKESLAYKKTQGILMGAAAPLYKENKKKGLHKPHVSKFNSKVAKERVSGVKDIFLAAINSHKAATSKKPTLREIANTLNKMGIPTPSGKAGSLWLPPTVSRTISRLEIVL